MLRRICFSLICVSLIGSKSVLAQTSQEAINFTGVTGGFKDNVPRVIGWEFTTGSQHIQVDQLGVYDHNQDGLVSSHGVAIYDFQTKTPVVTADVPSGQSATLSGFFRYVPVTPTILQANTEYVIASAWVGGGDELIWTPQGGTANASAINFSVNRAITLGLTKTGLAASGRFEDTTATLKFPEKRIEDVNPGDGRIAFIGPNFKANFPAVPAPSALVTLLIGVVPGMGVLLRRRRK